MKGFFKQRNVKQAKKFFTQKEVENIVNSSMNAFEYILINEYNFDTSMLEKMADSFSYITEHGNDEYLKMLEEKRKVVIVSEIK